MMAFAEVISKHIYDPIKLLIATAPTGAWNLIEIYERELGLRGITLEEGMRHIIFIDNPQGLTDEDINILFNASDVGINTAMGEGWGLCNFEAAACGIPQIVPAIGGFLDFFDSETSLMIKPKVKLYTDMSVDGCPGCAEICDSSDFAEAIEVYYNDENLRKKHATNARKKILTNYKWEDLGNKLYKQILTVAEKPEVNDTTAQVISLDDLESLEKNLNITSLNLSNLNIDDSTPKVEVSHPPVVTAEHPPPPEPVVNSKVESSEVSKQQKPLPPNHPVRKDQIKNRLKVKHAKKQEAKRKIVVVEESSEDEKIDKDELLKLRSRIDKLLSKS